MFYTMIYFNFIAVLMSISFIGVHSVSEKGCVPLDSVSFDKVVSKFKAVLVKFDMSFPFGHKQKAYESVCAASRVITDLLVTEVTVRIGGPLYMIDYPAVMLFTNNGQDAHTFIEDKEEDFNKKTLKNFILSKSGVYIGLDGCYEDFDNLALNFTVSTTREDKTKYLEAAEKILSSANSLQKQKSGETYVKYMKRLLEMGDEFINLEENNLKNGRFHNITMKREFDLKMNILNSFKINYESQHVTWS